VYGVQSAGAVTYQSAQTKLKGAPLRLFLIGYEPGRPGGPHRLSAGRQLTRSHYEMIADQSAGIPIGAEVPLGTHGHTFTVVGLTHDDVTAAGDPVAYITLLDAQQLQFELAPPSTRREVARGQPLQASNQINAVVAMVSPHVPTPEVAAALNRWKHLSTLTQQQQETLVTRFVIEKQRRQIALFTVLLVIVSAIIVALVIYTLTMDKVRSIATLKFIGAPDRTIVGMIVQQSLALGIVSFIVGLLLVLGFKDYFPRRVVLVPEVVSLLFVVAVVVCTQPVVRVEHLSKRFGTGETRVDALRDIDMDVFPGQVVGLMGPSGSGKTTLLNCIACILEPSGGRLTLDADVVYDNRWLKSDLRRLRLDKIGFIFQYPNLLPFLNAIDNVSVALHLAGFGAAAARSHALELLDYLEVGHRRNAMPAQLSGGEAQRVAIARALANRPRIILADEPTAPLDSQRARIVMDLLRKIAADQSAAIICVTHDEMILDRFDRIFRLRDGKLAIDPASAGASAQVSP
jgi:ABC-type lipoprotein export system ATPase subunit